MENVRKSLWGNHTVNSGTKKPILKYGFLFFFLFFGYSNAYACSCDRPMQAVNAGFMESDFVGKVYVHKVFDSPSKDSKTYRLEVQTREVFKGEEVNTLYVYGTRGYIISSCGVGIGEDEEWIVYAARNKEGKLAFGYCSNSKPIEDPRWDAWLDSFYEEPDGTHKESREQNIARELEMLNFLSLNLPDLKRVPVVEPVNTRLSSFLEKYKDIQLPPHSYSQYLIRFDRKLNIDSVEVLRGMDEALDAEIIVFLQCMVEWKVYGFVKPDSRFRQVFGIFYYPNRKEGTWFLSPYQS